MHVSAQLHSPTIIPWEEIAIVATGQESWLKFRTVETKEICTTGTECLFPRNTAYSLVTVLSYSSCFVLYTTCRCHLGVQVDHRIRG